MRYSSSARGRVHGVHGRGGDGFDHELEYQQTTIVFADVVESVRLVALDQAQYVARWRTLQREFAALVSAADGKLIERRGDGLLITMPDAAGAARFACRVHELCAKANAEVGADQAIVMRIGVHCAEILVETDAIYGEGVNLAARVAALAGPGETVFSDAARDGLAAGLDADIEDLGDCYLKHVERPIRTFRVGGVGAVPKLPTVNADPRDLLPGLAILRFSFNEAPESSSVMTLLCETVSASIAHTASLRVIAWLSSKSIRLDEPDFHEIGRKLGADWLLAGSIFVAAGRLVVNAQLIEATTGEVVHAMRETGSIDDLLEKNSLLAAAISSEVVASITSAEAKRVSRHALPTLSSHTLLLGAVGLMHRARRDDFHRSRDALEHLLERQPRMHSARPWLAKWFLLRHTRAIASTTPADTGRALAETSRALDSQPEDAFALAMRGFVYFHLVRDNDNARLALEQAVGLNPNEPLANSFLAAVIGVHGHFERSWELASNALALSPFDPLRAYMRMIASSCAFTSGRYDLSAQLAQESIRESATHVSAWRTLVIALVCGNRVAEARANVPRLMVVDPSLSVSSYVQRIQVPEPARTRAIEAMRVAGVPE